MTSVDAKSSKQSPVGLFFSSCSIRGVSKAYRTSSIKVKCLWVFFIILMVTLLLYSVIKILREYLEYNTTIQTRLQFDEPSMFPSFTICPFQPFSKRASDFFNKGGLSPMNYSSNIKLWAQHLLQNGNFPAAEKLIFYDSLRVYYQNLNYNDSLHIGLKEKEMLVFCMTLINFKTMIGEPDQNCGFEIIRFSSPEYFNCFTIKMHPKFSNSTQSVRLILRFPRAPPIVKKFENIALINSLTKNIIGAEVLIHESGTSPISIQEKIFIEPSRLLQINYRNNQWKEYNTPEDICVYDKQQSQTIRDLDQDYSYTYADCIKQYAAKAVLKACNCLLATKPRIVIPSKSAPYCAEFPKEFNQNGFDTFLKRLICVGQVQQRVGLMSNKEKNCYRRCEEQKFDLQISSINWHQSKLQLEWIYKINKAWNIMIEKPDNHSARPRAKQDILQFLQATTAEDLKFSDNELFSENEDYACLVLERMSNDTFFKEEKLGLSLYGLVSRIGGSCTLYLGLTCAFMVEILEFLILKMIHSKKGNNRNTDLNLNTNNEKKPNYDEKWDTVALNDSSSSKVKFKDNLKCEIKLEENIRNGKDLEEDD